MFIQTETTPNPDVIKFLPGQAVMSDGKTAAFRSVDKAAFSPLARALFALDGVAGVFLGADFISVTRGGRGKWDELKPQIMAVLMEFLTTGRPVIEEGKEAPVVAEEDSAIVVQIKEILETRIRPAVARDGGDIVFESFQNGIVFLQMQGACAGCPAAHMTLKMGVERVLRQLIPEVQEVRAVNE